MIQETGLGTVFAWYLLDDIFIDMLCVGVVTS